MSHEQADLQHRIPEMRLDVESPNLARMYDYMLGGAANFAIDRAAAAAFHDEFPWIEHWARANRAFLVRAVRHLTTEVGIDQFLDLGSGVPTVGNVHEIAQRENPQARVAYVDCEPIAVHHTQHLLAGTTRVSVTQADLCEPETVLTAPGVTQLLDFTRPVAVLAIAILDVLNPAHDLGDIVARYRDACCPGSAFALSHGVRTTLSEADAARFHETSAHHANTAHTWRTPEQLHQLLTGYTLITPGLVPTPQWRPEHPVSDEDARQFNAYAGIGLRH